jgi:hypothetical protein
MVALRFVDRQFGRGEDRAEEKPVAEVAGDEDGVLALPTETGRLREGFLHHGRGIDEHLDVRASPGGEKTRHLLELALDDVVIIAISGVDRDGRAVLLRQRGERIAVLTVIQSEQDDTADLGPKGRRRSSPPGGLGHPRHGSVTTLGEPELEPFRREGDGVRPRGANRVETQRRGAFP